MKKKTEHIKKYRLYFEEGNEENCFDLDCYQDRINDGEKSIDLVGAVISYGGDGLWCMTMGEMVERGSGDCGRSCSSYKPRNGKNGMCCEARNGYTSTGEEFILTNKGLTQIKDKLREARK